MISNAWLSIFFLALVLILPLAALRSQRLSSSKLLKLAAIWIAIFAGTALVVSLVRG